MPSVVEVFDNRAAEIKSYMLMLKAMDQPGAVIRSQSGNATTVATEWLKISKATAFLMLYNLVEASIRDSLAKMYERISTEVLTIDRVPEVLRDLWTDQAFKRIDAFSASPKSCKDVAVRLIKHIVANESLALDADRLPISGNLDAERTRAVCHIHGISVALGAAGKGGSQLDLVKDKRNDLAHGIVSFSECGRDFTVAQVDSICRAVIDYMRAIVRCIHKHTQDGHYRVN